MIINHLEKSYKQHQKKRLKKALGMKKNLTFATF